MKAVLAIFGLILCLLIMEKSWANEPAYQRECRIAGGLYWSISVNDTFDTPLCRFGEGVIGAADFAELKWNRKQSQAVLAYVGSAAASTPDAICASVGAKLVTGGDSNRDFWRVCIFADNSIIGADTLSRGQQNQSNGYLNQALGL
jgi:hypothetical protein